MILSNKYGHVTEGCLVDCFYHSNISFPPLFQTQSTPRISIGLIAYRRRTFSHDQCFSSPPAGAPRGQPMNGPRGPPVPGAANAPRGNSRPNSATNPGPRAHRPPSITPNGAGGVYPPMPGHTDAHAPGTPQRPGPGLPASASFTHPHPPTPSAAAAPHSVSSSVMRPPSRTASVDSPGPSFPQQRVCPSCRALA